MSPNTFLLFLCLLCLSVDFILMCSLFIYWASKDGGGSTLEFEGIFVCVVSNWISECVSIEMLQAEFA